MGYSPGEKRSPGDLADFKKLPPPSSRTGSPDE